PQGEMNPFVAIEGLLTHLRRAAGFDRLSSLLGEQQSLDALEPILEEAARFSQAWLAPLNSQLDTQGCEIRSGRVRTGPGHAEAWAAFCEAGWPTLDKVAVLRE